MSKLSEKLAKRIKEEFDIDVIPKIYRTRVGYHQKACGAWLWYMNSINGWLVASCYRASDVVKAKKLSIMRSHPVSYDEEILIEQQ